MNQNGFRIEAPKACGAAPATGTETDAICLLAVALLAEIESKLEGLRGCAQEDARSEERVCEMHS